MCRLTNPIKGFSTLLLECCENLRGNGSICALWLSDRDQNDARVELKNKTFDQKPTLKSLFHNFQLSWLKKV